MGKYILKRSAYIIFVFFVVSIILFLIYQLVPGDPARTMMEGSRAQLDPQAYDIMYQQARDKLGLDHPIHIQYIRWMGNMLKGDFGYSIFQRTNVANVVKSPLLNTVMINLCNLAIVFPVTVFLGITTAIRKKSVYDTSVQVFTVLGYSLPNFIFAILFILVFAVKLKWFPVSGMSSPDFSGNTVEFVADRAYYMTLPLLTMVFSSMGSLTRYVRTAMIEALSMDCIRTARAKGLKEKVVIYSHAFRNALIPIITVLTTWFINIFSGSVVIERTFVWNGMGKIMIDSLRNQDFAVSMAINVFYAVLTFVGYFILDLVYGLVDPRVKVS